MAELLTESKCSEEHSQLGNVKNTEEEIEAKGAEYR